MFIKPNSSSGIPIYLQLMEQIKHAIETGALRPGEQLPGIRNLAERLVINPNTIAKVYRELEHQGLLEIRHGTGAFVAEKGIDKFRLNNVQAAQPFVKKFVEKMLERGLNADEIRRLLEAELARRKEFARSQK